MDIMPVENLLNKDYKIKQRKKFKDNYWCSLWEIPGARGMSFAPEFLRY